MILFTEEPHKPCLNCPYQVEKDTDIYMLAIVGQRKHFTKGSGLTRLPPGPSPGTMRCDSHHCQTTAGTSQASSITYSTKENRQLRGKHLPPVTALYTLVKLRKASPVLDYPWSYGPTTQGRRSLQEKPLLSLPGPKINHIGRTG